MRTKCGTSARTGQVSCGGAPPAIIDIWQLTATESNYWQSNPPKSRNIKATLSQYNIHASNAALLPSDLA
jgi:hypothetical protein